MVIWGAQHRNLPQPSPSPPLSIPRAPFPTNHIPAPTPTDTGDDCSQTWQTGFPLRSPTVLLQWLLITLLKEGKPQTGQVRIPAQVHPVSWAERRAPGPMLATSFLIKLLPFPGHNTFSCLLPLFTARPLPGTSLPLLLDWLQKLPLRLQSQSHMPAPLRDFPDPTASQVRRKCPLCRCSRCTCQRTCAHLLLRVYMISPRTGISYLPRLCTSDQMAWQIVAQ